LDIVGREDGRFSDGEVAVKDSVTVVVTVAAAAASVEIGSSPDMMMSDFSTNVEIAARNK
jgi:hypothetical protein